MELELKDRIAAVRKAAGLTQEQLGELVGVTRQAVSKWESGQTAPDAATIAALCQALHVSADYVLLGKEPEESAAPAAPVYTPPDTCPCCGRAVEGTICPVCGYPLPAVPPRGPRYAVVSTSQYYYNKQSADQLVRYCGMTQEQAKATLEVASVTGLVLRRDLPDSAAQYLAAHLDRDWFPSLRVVEDGGESEDALRAKPSAMELPPPVQKDGGIGFWGVVGAVIVALLILSFL